MTENREESRKISRRQYLKYGAAAVVVVAAGAAGAYYYSKMPPATPSATATATATVTATASQTGPTIGGTLKYYMGADAVTLNPAISGLIETMDVGGAIFDRLMMRDWNLNLVPDLAESWSTSPDGKTYTFKLVKNAQWHDGTPLHS